MRIRMSVLRPVFAVTVMIVASLLLTVFAVSNEIVQSARARMLRDQRVIRLGNLCAEASERISEERVAFDAGVAEVMADGTLIDDDITTAQAAGVLLLVERTRSTLALAEKRLDHALAVRTKTNNGKSVRVITRGR